jgi:site-specific DNA recombinase
MKRLNREWHSSYDNRRKLLLEVQKQIENITNAVANGPYTRSLITKRSELEAQEDRLKKQLASAPKEIRIRPDIVETFRSKVEHLAETLRSPDEGDEMFALIRSLIDHITITPDLSVKRGKIGVTLHGDFATIFETVSVEPGIRRRSFPWARYSSRGRRPGPRRTSAPRDDLRLALDREVH